MTTAVNAHEEPNLVPLLDLVLQLVMFFMMCANFVMEQVDQTILLPVAQSARPMTEGKGDVLFLNINAAGELLIVGRPLHLATDAQIAGYLREVAADRRETLVIIRAHRDAEYASVYRILRQCQEAGLNKLQLRAIPVKG